MTRFVYRFQFLIDRIDESIRLTREDRNRMQQSIDQIQDAVRELDDQETRARNSLNGLAEIFLDRLEGSGSTGEEWMMHRIRRSGLLNRLEQIDHDRRRLRRCLREQIAELAAIDARVAALQRERSQFERNRTVHELRHRMETIRHSEKIADEAGQMIWHRNRSDSCEPHQN